MFKAIRALRRFKQPKNITIKENERVITSEVEAADLIAQHFRVKLSDTSKPLFFTPQEGGRLEKPIDKNEIERAAKGLKNGRAAGPDSIQGELLKYAPNELHHLIADILNRSFELNEDLKQLHQGTLIPLQKEGKPRGPVCNLRPIVLLTTARKILSLITLSRVRSNVEAFLSPTQSGFRTGRSTTDAVWAHRWLAATTQRHEVEIEILGIDMSSAFDTIDRQKLLENTTNIFGQDEWRMTEKLLSKTTLEVRLLKTKSRPFTTNIGSPQGDALSPILFNIYLECALRELRARLPRPPIDSLLPPEICYADDVDFLSRSKEYTEKVRTNATSSLIVWNLKVNEDKTSSETIKREKEHESETWRKTRKLGSLLGDSEDMAKRQQLAAAAFSSLKEMWSRRRIVREWTTTHLQRVRQASSNLQHEHLAAYTGRA